MEKSNKRGKIPQSDWPLIMARYDAGETLASIARTYDCSPPAISYVVSRSRARQPEQPKSSTPATAPEPQLIKAAAGESASAPPPIAAPPALVAAPVAVSPQAAGGDGNRRDGEALRAGNGGLRNDGDGGIDGAVPRPAAPANGDHRRTLHLSLGGAPQSNGGRAPEPPAAEARPSLTQRLPAAAERGGNGAGETSSTVLAGRSPGEPLHRNGGDAAPRREGGVFIDHELRARVEADIGAFLAAFDAALDQDTMESRSTLREATDRLLRAGARTRIELERLEARLPLPPRDGAGRANPAWRDR